MVPTELAVDAELVRDREEADADELPGIRLGAAEIAEVVVPDFSREVAIELIAAQNAPGGVLVVAARAILDLRLSDAAADIEGARIVRHLGCRGRRDYRCGETHE